MAAGRSARDLLISMSYASSGDWRKINEMIQNRDAPDEGALPDLRGWVPVTVLDEAYPKALLNAMRPPFVIYLKGDASLLSEDVPTVFAMGCDPCRPKARSSAIGVLKAAAGRGAVSVCVGLGDNGVDTLHMATDPKCGARVIAYIHGGAGPISLAMADWVASNGGLVVAESLPHWDAHGELELGLARMPAAMCRAAILLAGRGGQKFEQTSIAWALTAGKDIGALTWDVGDPCGKACADLLAEGAIPICCDDDAIALMYGQKPAGGPQKAQG